MKEIKLTIDGKEVQLTEKQLKVLRVEIEGKRKNPFERVRKNESYYNITSINDVFDYADRNDGMDKALYNAINYFNDKEFATQVALHQLLYRKLLKFAYDNKCEDTQVWDTRNAHYFIIYNYYTGEFAVDATGGYKGNTVYFSSEEGAERAVKEVIEPFMNEHLDFVW